MEAVVGLRLKPEIYKLASQLERTSDSARERETEREKAKSERRVRLRGEREKNEKNRRTKK